MRANTFDVPATKRPKDDAVDVRINRLRFITGCDLHLDISTSQPLNHVISATATIARSAHERWSEAPHAFVLQGARADKRELREFARTNFAHFKAPHSVTFIEELPKFATVGTRCGLMGDLFGLFALANFD